MWPLLLVFCSGARAGEGEPIIAVDEVHTLPGSHNWMRMYPRGDGTWDYFFAADHNYVHNLLSADMEVIGEDLPLTPYDYLTDHSLALCPDGSWLHVASATLGDSHDDSAIAFRYGADFNLLAEATIALRDEALSYNDTPAICHDLIDGVPGQPRNLETGDDIEAEGVFLVLDEDAEAEAELRLWAAPPVTGGSLLIVEEDQEMLLVRASGISRDLWFHQYDPETLRERRVERVDVVPEGTLAWWPQGLLRIGDYYFIAHIGKTETDVFEADMGNVWIQVLDLDFNLIQSLQVTEYDTDVGAMRPSLAVQGDQLVVVFDVIIYPRYVTMTLADWLVAPELEMGPDQRLQLGETATLSATARHPSDLPLTAAWELRSAPEGSALGTADLSAPTELSTDFTADVPGAYTFELSVTDGSQTSSGEVEVYWNGPPLAEAGPDLDISGLAPVRFDGSASQDPDGDELSWSWRLLLVPTSSARTDADLAGRDGPLVELQPDQPGQYRLELTVSDGAFEASDTVDLRVGEEEGCSCGRGKSLAPLLLLGVGLRRRRKKT